MSVFDRQPSCKCCVSAKTGFATPKELNNIILGNNADTVCVAVPQADLYDGADNYIRLQPNTTDNAASRILMKIQSGNGILGNICKVNQGIVSGADKISERHITKYGISGIKDDGIFVLNKANQNDSEILQQIYLHNEQALLAPFYKNSDVHRYYTEVQNNSYILYTDRQTSLSAASFVYNHLSKYKPVLASRREVVNNVITFTQLQWPREVSIFNGPKIVAPQRSTKNTFGYNEIPWYASADVYFITSPKSGYDLKYILGVLNSKLYYFWLYHKGKRKGETLELYQKPLSEVPIKRATADKQNKIIAKTNEIITLAQQGISVSDKEEELNMLVYELYGITAEEIAFIQDFL